MSDKREDRLLEPMRMWREWYQKSEKQWSEMLTDAMADEKFGKTFGHLFQEWLHAQHMLSEMIGQPDRRNHPVAAHPDQQSRGRCGSRASRRQAHSQAVLGRRNRASG
jgi:hypothetical protein